MAGRLEEPTSRASAGDSSIVVCLPIYDDWPCAEQVVRQLDVSARELGRRVSVLLVDDGSNEPPPTRWAWEPEHLMSVEILQLRRNVGHQRAIAVGMTYIYEHCPCELVVVMDGDGQDSPFDVAALVDRCERTGRQAVVFARRSRRSEGRVFRMGYLAYRVLHRVLTGRAVEVGNFSVVPRRCLERLIIVSEMWNHYAASVIEAHLPTATVPIPRRERLMGQTKMNFVSLVTHGLSAMSVYADTIGVRLLCFAAVLMTVAAVALAIVLGIYAFTNLAIPGWATSAAGLLAVLIVNTMLLMAVFTLFILHGRNALSFIPLRDYHHFVLRRIRLHG